MLPAVVPFVANSQRRLAMETNPTQQDDGNERLAGDLLVGADAVHAFLVHLGMPETVDPYYLKRSGHWPIGNRPAPTARSSPQSAD